jgi:hypothetical protein
LRRASSMTRPSPGGRQSNPPLDGFEPWGV